MTVCHLSWILFLEPFTECAHSVRIRTDGKLDQDCVLKATVQVCTACMVVPLLTTCMNFYAPPLAQIAPARFASQTRNYHSTKKLRKHVCQLIHVCTTQSVQAPFDARFASQTRKKARLCQVKAINSSFRVSKRSPWLVYNHSMVLKQRLLSLCHPRASLGSDCSLKVVCQEG